MDIHNTITELIAISEEKLKELNNGKKDVLSFDIQFLEIFGKLRSKQNLNDLDKDEYPELKNLKNLVAKIQKDFPTIVESKQKINKAIKGYKTL